MTILAPTPEQRKIWQEKKQQFEEELAAHPERGVGEYVYYLARCMEPKCGWAEHATAASEEDRDHAERKVATRAHSHRARHGHTVVMRRSEMNQDHRVFFKDGGEA